MRLILPALLTLSVAFMGCKAKEAFDKASVAHDLEKRGTMDVLKEASKDKYTAPKDGRLTDSQIQMYLKVRDHEKMIAQAAKQKLQKQGEEVQKAGGEKSVAGMVEGLKSLNTFGELITADIRAAKDLGYNTAEYQWVKGQILAASTSAMAEQVSAAMNAQLDAGYQQMKKSVAEAKDEQTKKVYAEALAGYEKSRQEMHQQKEDPAIAYNRQLLSKYENAMNAYAAEVSKYEDKPGEVQKGMDQWQKDMAKATADAKKRQ